MTLESQMRSPGGPTTGFDYLRIGLSIGVLLSHCVYLTCGVDAAFIGSFSVLPKLLLPMFFALSGFLVTGSLMRVKLHQFVVLRMARILPALAVEITLSAIMIGPALTTVSLRHYFSSDLFYSYFLNIFGDVHLYLPGVFPNNPVPDVMNGQLWTIPFELECYLALMVLSILKIVQRRLLFSVAVLAVSIAYTMRVMMVGAIGYGHVPGRLLVITFLAAVAVYLYKDVLPFSRVLGVSSFFLSVALLNSQTLSYLAPFPMAYTTVWLGLMRPPAIPFGDLSYGIFLFHWPVEQTIVFLLPHLRTWWLLAPIALPLTAACAWLSWTFIESPFLAHKKQILMLSDRIVYKARGAASWVTKLQVFYR